MTEELLTVPTCSLWIDGARYADGSAGEDPAALTGLVVTWGRTTILDQPEPSTCNFQIADKGGDQYRTILKVGTAIQVRADAMIYPDPTQSTAAEPGFEGTGTVAARLTNCAVARVSAPDPVHAGAQSLRVLPTTPTSAAKVVLLPAPTSTDPTAWDLIPRVSVGQTWRYGLSVYLGQYFGTAQRVEIRPVIVAGPQSNAVVTVLSDVLSTTAQGWTVLSGDTTPDVAGWLGVEVTFFPTSPKWNDVGGAVTWNGVLPAGLRWNDVGALWVDDLVLLAPSEGVLREAVVFDGRVTDVDVSWDEDIGGALLDVNAQDNLAELGNRFVGETPWPTEGLGTRFGKIITASDHPTTYTVASSLSSYSIARRDVDSQPAQQLLTELAISAGGVLWSATHLVTGQVLKLEDPATRTALMELKADADGIIRIVQIGVPGENQVVLNSCDVELDPLHWVQDTSDDSTRVRLTYKDVTPVAPNPPVDVTLEVIDPAAEELKGRLTLSVSTQLSSSVTAGTVANKYLAMTDDGWRIVGVTYRPRSLTAEALMQLMAVLDGTLRIGLSVMVTELPAWSPSGAGSSIPLYIEGGRFTFDQGWTLELVTSSGAGGLGHSVVWNELPVADATRTNLATNPRAVSTGAAAWNTVRTFGTGAAGTYSFVTGLVGPTGATDITTARRKAWTTAATANTDSGYEVRAAATDAIPVTAGTTYTFSAWMKFSGTGTRIARMRLVWRSAAIGMGSAVGSVAEGTDVTLALPDTWYRVSMTVDALAGAAAVLVYPDIRAGGTLWAVGNTLDCTGLLVEAIDSAGTYFDGATPDTSTVNNAWVGTADASASTATSLVDTWNWNEWDPAIRWVDLSGVGNEVAG